MSHGPNRHRAEKRAAERAAAHDRRNPPPSPRAQRIVAAWNERARAGEPAEFFPTFRTVLAAGCRALTYQCPTCQQAGTFDVRTAALQHHPQAPISVLIPQLSCQRCCANPPFARLTELHLPQPEPRLVARRAPDPKNPTYKIFLGNEEVGYIFAGMSAAGYDGSLPWVWGYHGPLGRYQCSGKAATRAEALAAFRAAWTACGPGALADDVKLHKPTAERTKKT